jgi:hypothetical protein
LYLQVVLPLKVPQWSPPWNGGSTPTHTFTDVTNIVPQWSRRQAAGTLGLPVLDGQFVVAAMEPAAGRREHLFF